MLEFIGLSFNLQKINLIYKNLFQKIKKTKKRFVTFKILTFPFLKLKFPLQLKLNDACILK